jgi:hypothetical protein
MEKLMWLFEICKSISHKISAPLGEKHPRSMIDGEKHAVPG